MDEQVKMILRDYIEHKPGNIDIFPNFDIYIVWKCKTLQNWKYLLATDMIDGLYYELTYNGDKKEWYLDEYKKLVNKVIPG